MFLIFNFSINREPYDAWMIIVAFSQSKKVVFTFALIKSNRGKHPQTD